jgi:hypothetical protein
MINAPHMTNNWFSTWGGISFVDDHAVGMSWVDNIRAGESTGCGVSNIVIGNGWSGDSASNDTWSGASYS